MSGIPGLQAYPPRNADGCVFQRDGDCLGYEEWEGRAEKHWINHKVAHAVHETRCGEADIQLRI